MFSDQYPTLYRWLRNCRRVWGTSFRCRRPILDVSSGDLHTTAAEIQPSHAAALGLRRARSLLSYCCTTHKPVGCPRNWALWVCKHHTGVLHAVNRQPTVSCYSRQPHSLLSRCRRQRTSEGQGTRTGQRSEERVV